MMNHYYQNVPSFEKLQNGVVAVVVVMMLARRKTTKAVQKPTLCTSITICGIYKSPHQQQHRKEENEDEISCLDVKQIRGRIYANMPTTSNIQPLLPAAVKTVSAQDATARQPFILCIWESSMESHDLSWLFIGLLSLCRTTLHTYIHRRESSKCVGLDDDGGEMKWRSPDPGKERSTWKEKKKYGA